MEKFTIKDLYAKPEQFADKQVSIEGWIKTSRGSKKICFIEANDGSFLKNAQIIVKNDNPDFDEIRKWPIASTIHVDGTFVSTPDAPQPFEIHASKINLEGHSSSDFPLQKKEQSYEYLRTLAHLRPRTNTFYSVFKVRSMAAFAVHQYLQSHGFTYVNTPIITSSDAEGAGETFRVTTLDMNDLPKTEDGKVDDSKDFFREKANLTVSGQLSVEAYALALRNVYTFGPTFRAENSHTARHASEFWMIEPEMAFATLKDTIKVSEGLLKYVIKYLFDNAKEELDFLNSINDGLIDRLKATINEDFAKVTYTEAIKMLEESGHEFEVPVKWGIDLQSEHERYLCEHIYNKPVFLTDYPRNIKAFYMRDNDDGKTVAAADLLVPEIGEMVGGSQREEREDKLRAKIDEFGLNEEEYNWYLELRKYGETIHSGFGIGFERLVMYVTGMANIRDVIPYPRTPGNAPF
ncbi:asparagine--tRNA ligase [Apilactobacillus xinyiensis]|uniref:asparagine--tRNA ligase n=1 Tax=Apilactobacillus xinyiensis TaxID=2841032 RepID=UPI00201086CA|nr:asparagine--tRNA ligase [Apilactobacillus xinyiensis]MCL0330085.1 asparagine--tRNA ligase [Apilactobacillus xinyiensis]